MNETDLLPTPGAPAGFPYEENHLRYKMGLTKEDMRRHRQEHLMPSTDFTVHKKRVYWSLAAVRRLLAVLSPSPKKNAPAPPARSGADPAPAKTTPPEIVTLRVVRCDLPNKHMLHACLPTEDPDRPKKTLRVRVRDTANFVRRMELPALRVEGYTDLYDLAHALPRKKGKW